MNDLRVRRSTDGTNAGDTAGRAPGRSTLTGRHVMRRARDDQGIAPDADAAIARAGAGGGAPLPNELRGRFESSLGADLSAVRVHTGSDSAAATESVGARAYALGQDIHFGAGQYAPGSSDGDFLIAHEVAHTVQQQGAGGAAPQAKLEVSAPGDAAEVEADRAADAMVAGAPAAISPAVGLSRQIMRDASFTPDLGVQDLGGDAVLGTEIKHAVHVVNAGKAPAGTKYHWGVSSIDKKLTTPAPVEKPSGVLKTIPKATGEASFTPRLYMDVPGDGHTELDGDTATYAISSPTFKWDEMASGAGGSSKQGWKLKAGETLQVIASAKGAKHLKEAADAIHPKVIMSGGEESAGSFTADAGAWIDDESFAWTITTNHAGKSSFLFQLQVVGQLGAQQHTVDVESTIDGDTLHKHITQAHLLVDTWTKKVAEPAAHARGSAYSTAYQGLLDGLKSGFDNEKLAIDICLGIALAGLGGIAGGALGGVVKGPIDGAIQGAKGTGADLAKGAVTDLSKDLAKFAAKDFPKLVIKPSSPPGPLGANPLNFENDLLTGLSLQVGDVYELLLGMSMQMDDKKSDYSFDPLPVVTERLNAISIPAPIASDEYLEALWCAWLQKYAWQCKLAVGMTAPHYEAVDQTFFLKGEIDKVAKRRGASYAAWMKQYGGIAEGNAKAEAATKNLKEYPWAAHPEDLGA